MGNIAGSFIVKNHCATKRERLSKWDGSAIEIEERKIAEEKIREQEIELRQILDLTPQHIAVFGPDGEPTLHQSHSARIFRHHSGAMARAR